MNPKQERSPKASGGGERETAQDRRSPAQPTEGAEPSAGGARRQHSVLALLLLLLVGLFAYVQFKPAAPPTLQGNAIQQRELADVAAKDREIKVLHLDRTIAVRKGVFTPFEAETFALPLMSDNPALFRSKTVLDIGTGSGVIALHAAKLGAKKVIATDISPVAIENARFNAIRMGVGDIVDARLVEIDEGVFDRVPETLDVIIANPPYSLDLDAERNSEVIDSGDLGFSIIDGLEDKLTPDGKAILLYLSYFYHHVIVRYARHRGYEVVHHNALYMTNWEVDALFNGYAARISAREGLEHGVLAFDHRKEPIGSVRIVDHRQPPMLANSNGIYPGMIVISLPNKVGK